MKDIDWNQALIPGAVWIQFKDSLPDASGWAYLSLDEKWYKFIGLSREYEVERFQEPNSIGKVYTNHLEVTPDPWPTWVAPAFKENAWNYDFDFDRNTELFVTSCSLNESSGLTSGSFFISERSLEENPWPSCGLGGTSPVPEGYHPPKMNRQEYRKYYEGIFKPFPDHSVPLLDEIKHSRRTLYQEELSDSEAQDILDRMRIDIEKAFGMPRKWL